jgi:MraZ protein
MHLIGKYYHALEQKGRLSIPKAFRTQISSPAILTLGLDSCLFLFPESQWQVVIQEAGSLPFTKKNTRDWTRLLANNAQSVEFDRLGRILVPDHLKSYAKLDKQIVIVGSINRVEIWDQQQYHTYLDTIQDQAVAIAESLTTTE